MTRCARSLRVRLGVSDVLQVRALVQVGVDELGFGRDQAVDDCSAVQRGFASAIRSGEQEKSRRRRFRGGNRHGAALLLTSARLASTVARTRAARLPAVPACVNRASMASRVNGADTGADRSASS